MNSYSVKFLTFHHGVELYPCILVPSLYAANAVKVRGADEFEVALAMILQHEKTRAVLAGLLAQIKSQPKST